MGTSKIKGITVEIGGNLTKLQEALSESEVRGKDLGKQLSAVNRLLKLDPSNTELLAQKQGILSNTISNTKKRLDLLREAQAKMEEEAKTDTASKEKYEELRREIIATERKLGTYEKALDDCKRSAEQAGKETKDFGNKAVEASRGVDALDRKVDDLRGSLDDAKDSFKDAMGDIGAIGAAGVAAAGAVAAVAMSYDDALKRIQSTTGATDGQMRGIQTALDGLHADGYGEDLDDIASTIAVIVQNTGELDAEPLRELAENAVTLRDSFDMDTADQMRAVTQLQKHFNLTAKESYDLIAAGAQKGLNRNGDLLDVINEYSNHFADMGYSGRDFFSMLENGVKTGVFSVDKLGDAWKEFGIRTRDGSESTLEAFTTLGLDGERLSSMFAAGGAEARQACEEVNDALFAMKDPLAQNQAGVALYGTMWEDLGKDAIQALSDTKGELSATMGVMEDIKAVRMDSASQEWKKLGRSVQQEVLQPLGKQLLPTAKSFLSFLAKNMDKLLPKLRTIGAAVAGMYAGKKAGNAISSVAKLVKAYKDLKTAASAANLAMNSNAIGIASAAIGGLIALVVGLCAQTDEAAEKQRELMQSYKDTQAAALEAQQKRAEAVSAIDEEYDGYRELVKELDGLVDAEGRVKKGCEDRVNYIRGALSEATGIEIQLVDGVIQKYGELSQSIETVILEKQAEAYLTSQGGSYEQAKSTVDSMEKDETGAYQMGSQAAYEATREQIRNREEEYHVELGRLQEAYNEVKSNHLISGDALPTIMRQIEDLHVTFAQDMAVLNARADAALLSYDANMTAIRQYEGVQNAVYADDAEALQGAMDAAANGIMLAVDASLASLQEQERRARENYEKLYEWSKKEGSTVTQEQLDQAAKLVALTAGQVRLELDELGVSSAEKSPVYASQKKVNDATLTHYERFGRIMDDSPIFAGRGALEVHDEQTSETRRLLARQELLLASILHTIDGMDLSVNIDGERVANKIISHVDSGLGRVVHSANRGALTADFTRKE